MSQQQDMSMQRMLSLPFEQPKALHDESSYLQALHESNARFREAFDYAAIGMALVGLDGQWLQVNPAVCQMMGYTAEELHALTFQDLTHPDDLNLDLANVRQLLDGQIPTYQMEKRYLHKQGRIIWAVLSVSLVRDAAGTPLYFISQIQDKTPQKEAEAALRESEFRFRTLVEQLPAIIYTANIDPNSTTSYVSPQIHEILGYTADEWLADPELWLKQIYADDRELVLNAVTHVQRSSEPLASEYRGLTRDGRVVWLRDTARVVRDTDGTPLFLQGITLDITEQKVAEQALRESEQLYRTLAHNFPNGAVFLFDHDLRYTLADGQALALFDLTGEQIEGRRLYDVFPGELAMAEEPYYLAALQGAQSSREVEIDGQTFMTYYLPVRNEQGQIYAGLVVAHGITERQQAERALREERTLLAQRIAERTADLSAANAELARAARLKDEFLANMSHELRTPLHGVLALTETLREETFGALTGQQDRALLTIEESGRHLLVLINDILDVAKISAGKLDIDIERTAIDQVCDASIRLVRQVAHKKQIAVRSTIDPAIGELWADTRRLKQILVNLLTNAVKFTPAGGSVGLEVSCNAAEQITCFTVWDTGIGISTDGMQRLFQPFIQLDSRLAREYEGTGLGLVLVARLTELHGGSVEVASEVGQGSRFTVSLPWHPLGTSGHIPEEGEHQASAQGELRTPGASQQTILVADDNETSSATTAEYLASAGYRIVLAHNGDAVVAQARETLPDLILMDIQMPGMDGLEAIRRIRTNDRLAHTPIIALTALTMPGHRERCLVAGASDYLKKPLSLRAMGELVRAQLAERM
jgi:PAS domain S-box-containing protein